MLLGAHVTTSKGLLATAEKAKTMGANCLQLFVSPPRNWHPPKWIEEQLLEFKNKLDELKIGPIFLHGIYLVNLHTESHETRQKAVESVISYQKIADTIGAIGTIIHSHHPNNTFRSAVAEILDKTEVVISRRQATSNPVEISHLVRNDHIRPLLILEHSAINTLEDTFVLFRATPKVDKDTSGVNDRLGFCLDTCHLLAAGYDVRKLEVIDEILDKIEQGIGLDKLKVIHLNDAKSKLGSRRDIHQNIGEGSIGKDAFGLWLNHPKLKHLPFIIETPGFDDKGPDKENLDILKSLIS